MRFAKCKKAAVIKTHCYVFSYFQTPSNVYITSKEAKTGNWAQRRAGNSKNVKSSEMQKFILVFMHILILQEDWTFQHKLNSLCQPDCLILRGSVTKPNWHCLLIKASPNSIKLEEPGMLSSLTITTMSPAFSWAIAVWYSASLKHGQTFILDYTNFNIYSAMLDKVTGGLWQCRKGCFQGTVTHSFCLFEWYCKKKRKKEIFGNFWIKSLCSIIVKCVFKTKHMFCSFL